jgi:hypothetical protein
MKFLLKFKIAGRQFERAAMLELRSNVNLIGMRVAAHVNHLKINCELGSVCTVFWIEMRLELKSIMKVLESGSNVDFE